MLLSASCLAVPADGSRSKICRKHLEKPQLEGPYVHARGRHRTYFDYGGTGWNLRQSKALMREPHYLPIHENDVPGSIKGQNKMKHSRLPQANNAMPKSVHQLNNISSLIKAAFIFMRRLHRGLELIPIFLWCDLCTFHYGKKFCRETGGWGWCAFFLMKIFSIVLLPPNLQPLFEKERIHRRLWTKERKAKRLKTLWKNNSTLKNR